MIDLGKERQVPEDNGMDMPMPSTAGGEKPKMKTIIDYPNLHLESDEMPGITGVGFGQQIKLTFIAKVTGIRKQDWNGGKICYDFDLMQGDAVPLKETPVKQNTKASQEDVSGIESSKATMGGMDMGEATYPEDVPAE